MTANRLRMVTVNREVIKDPRRPNFHDLNL
jgi:hypothetical protein